MERLQDIFVSMFNMSITASYVILAVLLIRLCLKKASKTFAYGLWAVAGFRLVCPFSFSSAISIFNFIGSKNETGASINYISSSAGNIKSESPVINYAVGALNSSPLAHTPVSVSPIQLLLSITTVLWIIGIVLILTYCTSSYLRLKYRIRSAVLLRDDVYQSETIPSPFVMGILHPRIYIPFHMDEPELSYVLLHEKHHIRRYDHLIKPLSFLLAALYWYNPLVWIAYICMCKDMEMSCDEKVIKDMGVSIKKAYSMSLLSFATNRSFPAASPLSFGEINIKGRIKNILNYKKTKLWVTIFLATICFITIISCIANPSSKAPLSPETESAENEDTTGVSALAKQLYDVRNPYIGNASANGTLLITLGVGDELGTFTLELETSKPPYILRLNFDEEVYDRDNFDHQMASYATYLLALIDNADELQWSYPYNEAGEEQRITVYWDAQNLQPLGIEDIKTYGESAAKVQELMDLMETNGFDMNLASAANVTDNNDGSPKDGNPLVMNDVIKQKDWSKVSLEDLKAYGNFVMEETQEEGLLNSYLTFDLNYGDDLYKLQVSYLKADQQIDLIYLTRQSDMETVLLYSSYPKYKVTTDLEGYLTTKINMSHYLTYQLLPTMENSAYNAAIGIHGGNLFFINGELPNAGDQAPKEWSAPGGVLLLPLDSLDSSFSYVTFEQGRLINGQLGNNHTSVLGEPIILNDLSEQAVLVKVQHDLYTASDIAAAEEAGNPIPPKEQVSTMYEIYFAREDSLKAYCIFLNTKYFTYDAAISLAKSVKFTDQAFN
jgi:beta-lactamase regulating signal transducer with metallopeptidase domain